MRILDGIVLWHVFVAYKKIQKVKIWLGKGAYWAIGGILASLVGRGVGCIAAT